MAPGRHEGVLPVNCCPFLGRAVCERGKGRASFPQLPCEYRTMESCNPCDFFLSGAIHKRGDPSSPPRVTLAATTMQPSIENASFSGQVAPRGLGQLTRCTQHSKKATASSVPTSPLQRSPCHRSQRSIQLGKRVHNPPSNLLIYLSDYGRPRGTSVGRVLRVSVPRSVPRGCFPRVTISVNIWIAVPNFHPPKAT